jgi:hypothetical protein
LLFETAFNFEKAARVTPARDTCTKQIPVPEAAGQDGRKFFSIFRPPESEGGAPGAAIGRLMKRLMNLMARAALASSMSSLSRVFLAARATVNHETKEKKKARSGPAGTSAPGTGTRLRRSAGWSPKGSVHTASFRKPQAVGSTPTLSSPGLKTWTKSQTFQARSMRG